MHHPAIYIKLGQSWDFPSTAAVGGSYCGILDSRMGGGRGNTGARHWLAPWGPRRGATRAGTACAGRQLWANEYLGTEYGQ